ncbi:MAG TPA: sugar ABC transporter ATP-binding protein [Planctomycetota bacterium]|nr:sugar ABC transporter ATP-binding protein [Planctomycetota bacterium]
MSAPLFRMTCVSKSFGATRALRDISFAVKAGEIRALVGENGAGKSTLLGILAGVHQPDSGSMEVGGAAFAPRGPKDASKSGVAMIHQELAIAPDLSLAENIALGAEPAHAGFVDRTRMRDQAKAALARLSTEPIDVDRAAREFPLSTLQLVEIARALCSQARVIVFDEPTSSLGKADATRLFQVIRELGAQGLAIVVVTHFLEELPLFADTYTVLRDGEVVAEGPIAGTTSDDLVQAMVGRSIDLAFPRVPRTPGDVLLSVESLSGQRTPSDVSLKVRRGEVLGLAGLVGAGRSEFLRCVFGLDRRRSGIVRIADAPLRSRSPRESIRRRLGFLSEDRKGEGLALDQSIEDNLTLSRLGPYSRGGWLSLRKRRTVVREALERACCKPGDPSAILSSLSGGNQQKVAFARLLHQEAEILLLDEPTRGIDVATKSEIYQTIGELAASGKAIVIASSHFPELLHVCDRIAVFQRGNLGAVRPASDWTEASLLRAASGVGS